MQNSRTKNSMLIILTSGVRQILTLVLTFVSRTVFIKILGAEYLGLNGLFSNILSLLALSELGIGAAISFYLYQPLADNDIERIKTLMKFYKICYRVIGLAIVGIGCCIMPFLAYMVNFDQGVPGNLYLVYFIYLLNTASSYSFFAYKQALVTANQEQYKIENINIAFSFINCLADIIVLIIARNFVVYLIVKLLLVMLKNVIIAIKINKEYPYLKEKNVQPLKKKEVMIFFKDVGAVAIFKSGSTLFNATDNIVISMLLGTVVVGYYSNYFMIISQITIIINIIVRSFAAGIGNVIAKESKERHFAIFKQIDFLVYFVVTVCTACFFQLLNSFVKIWIGNIDANYVLSQSVIIFLCMNFFFDGTTQIMNSFREGSGNFSTGKYLQIFGGIVNIILSVVLGKIFGLSGIFAATVISKGFITLLPFMVGISKDVFDKGKYTILLKYIKNGIVAFLSIALLWFTCTSIHMTDIAGFVLECILSILIPSFVLIVVFFKTDEMTQLRKRASYMVIGFRNK
ncbi:lipopolysaccharide biosynthesis protein [[Clostridium] fimetarium]|uniref:Membrane protein involved in the export of O-antigen and teichoic acid n=1 Tax=[Clostridium] fimetarium TaxID=99656 RepID=A0A1I0RLV9_9FIRM|nr:hypothetical protein [[Clostridium] fimetarium]SEW42028.1 Membrane protein involved in the export of O-antigen and teichoic acid [[Clostridium] fimetarium]